MGRHTFCLCITLERFCGISKLFLFFSFLVDDILTYKSRYSELSSFIRLIHFFSDFFTHLNTLTETLGGGNGWSSVLVNDSQATHILLHLEKVDISLVGTVSIFNWIKKSVAKYINKLKMKTTASVEKDIKVIKQIINSKTKVFT